MQMMKSGGDQTSTPTRQQLLHDAGATLFKKTVMHGIKRNKNLYKDKTQHVVNVVTAITVCLVPEELVSDLSWLL